MQIKHKDIVQSKNLADKAGELIGHINGKSEITITLKAGRKSGKSRKEGGARIPIEKPERKRAERKYRRKAAHQTTVASQDLESDPIIDDISFCAWWDWRW